MFDPDTTVLARLNRLIGLGRLPHALLFVGSNHEKLVSSALSCAQAINCPAIANQQACAGCESCRLLAANNHPDVKTFRCADFDGDAMDTLREVLAGSHRKPFLGRSRITILGSSDALSLAALNLLLKTLEEPRPNNYYILTTPSASLLPSTIVSRSQVWFFPDDLSALSALEPETTAKMREQVQRIAAGEMHTGILLATRLHKEFKEQTPQVISTLQQIGREHLLATNPALNEASANKQTARWARFLGDLCELEYAIGTRNFNGQYQFAWTFERLATQ